MAAADSFSKVLVLVHESLKHTDFYLLLTQQVKYNVRGCQGTAPGSGLSVCKSSLIILLESWPVNWTELIHGAGSACRRTLLTLPSSVTFHGSTRLAVIFPKSVAFLILDASLNDGELAIEKVGQFVKVTKQPHIILDLSSSSPENSSEILLALQMR